MSSNNGSENISEELELNLNALQHLEEQKKGLEREEINQCQWCGQDKNSNERELVSTQIDFIKQIIKLLKKKND